MKFTDLSPQKQNILRAFIAGETIQVYTPSTSWKDTDMGNFFYVLSNCHHDWLRVRTKELEPTNEPTIQSAKELKAGLESEILRLIGDFNKKTNLEVQDIDLDCYRVIGGGCFYRINVKVEI